MENAKSSLADKLKTANNILVTVSRNPSVDQLAACIGLTIVLNKQGKHAAAVFSGAVPSTMEFLQPEATLEKNTDSLRDFIIALDKSKADKLRYKVEDNVVRIFITPYKTSISQDDLEFSQGDFNVDVVVALGVREQQDLDDAITAHGRILHDATVTSINVTDDGSLGSINWNDSTASSLSELVTELVPLLGENLLDEQISTALLTGIVAETDRFSNAKTSPHTMSASAQLMAAGANQQLVATKLEEAAAPQAIPEVQPKPEAEQKADDGTLAIDHNNSSEPPIEPKTDEKNTEEPVFELPPPVPIPDDELVDSEPTEQTDDSDSRNNQPSAISTNGPKLITEEPTMSGKLTANTEPEGLDPAIDPLSANNGRGTILQHGDSQTLPNASTLDELLRNDNPAKQPDAPEEQTAIVEPLQLNPDIEPEFTLPPTPVEPSKPMVQDKPTPMIQGLTPPPPAWVPPSDDPFNTGEKGDKTLSQLEQAVHSPHLVADNQVNDARDEVNRALSNSPAVNEPIHALNAQPLGDLLHPESAAATPPAQPMPGFMNPTPPAPPEPSLDANHPQIVAPSVPVAPPTTDFPPVAITPAPQVNDPNAPPPVPPPIPFQFGK